MCATNGFNRPRSQIPWLPLFRLSLAVASCRGTASPRVPHFQPRAAEPEQNQPGPRIRVGRMSGGEEEGCEGRSLRYAMACRVSTISGLDSLACEANLKLARTFVT